MPSRQREENETDQIPWANLGTASRTVELRPRNNWHRQKMTSWRKVWGLLGGSEQDALHLIRMCANGAFPEWQSVNARVVGDDTRPQCLAKMWGREYCRTGSGRVYLEDRLVCPEVQPGWEEQADCRAVHMGVPDTRQPFVIGTPFCLGSYSLDTVHK